MGRKRMIISGSYQSSHVSLHFCGIEAGNKVCMSGYLSMCPTHEYSCTLGKASCAGRILQHEPAHDGESSHLYEATSHEVYKTGLLLACIHSLDCLGIHLSLIHISEPTRRS